MPPQVLLAQLQTLLARTPSFANYSPSSKEHLVWLGQAHALVSRWRAPDALMFRVSCDMLGGVSFAKDSHIAEILGTLHRAVADLELALPVSTQQSFGPGALYDFFKAFGAVLASAQKSVYIVDPYMDEGIFDSYLSGVPKNVSVRLLVREHPAKLKVASERFAAQHGHVIELKRSKSLHDRVIFIDRSECWVLGHSIKDAAAIEPTYLAPLAPDVSKR